MKALTGLIFTNLHWFLLLYFGYDYYTQHEQKMMQLAQKQAQEPRLIKQIRDARQKVNDINEFKKNLLDSRKRVAKVLEQIREIQRKLPSEESDTDVLEILENQTSVIGMRKVSLSPGDLTEKGFYFEKNFNVKAHSTYLQAMIFFERLQENQRLFNVNELVLKTGRGGQKGRYKVIEVSGVIQSYRYNADYEEKVPADT